MRQSASGPANSISARAGVPGRGVLIPSAAGGNVSGSGGRAVAKPGSGGALHEDIGHPQSDEQHAPKRPGGNNCDLLGQRVCTRARLGRAPCARMGGIADRAVQLREAET